MCNTYCDFHRHGIIADTAEDAGHSSTRERHPKRIPSVQCGDVHAPTMRPGDEFITSDAEQTPTQHRGE